METRPSTKNTAAKKSNRRKEPTGDQREAADNQERYGYQEEQQSLADQPGSPGHLKSLRPQHFQELLMISRALFGPFFLLPEHLTLNKRNRDTSAPNRS